MEAKNKLTVKYVKTNDIANQLSEN